MSCTAWRKTVPIGESYRGIVPFLVSDTVRIVLLLLFPAIYAVAGAVSEIASAAWITQGKPGATDRRSRVSIRRVIRCDRRGSE